MLRPVGLQVVAPGGMAQGSARALGERRFGNCGMSLRRMRLGVDLAECTRLRRRKTCEVGQNRVLQKKVLPANTIWSLGPNEGLDGMCSCKGCVLSSRK